MPETITPIGGDVNATYVAALAQQYVTPDHGANLTAVVNLYAREEQEQAGKMLASPDHGLDTIKFKARSGLEPVLATFDAQLAAIEQARSGPVPTITQRGFDEQAAV